MRKQGEIVCQTPRVRPFALTPFPTKPNRWPNSSSTVAAKNMKHLPAITFHSNVPVKSSQALQVEPIVLPNQTFASFEGMIAGLSCLPGTVNRESCLADHWRVHIGLGVVRHAGNTLRSNTRRHVPREECQRQVGARSRRRVCGLVPVLVDIADHEVTHVLLALAERAR